MYFWKLFDKGLLGFIQPLLLLSIWFEASGIQLYRLDEDQSALLTSLQDKIIRPAEDKAKELEKKRN